jgi:hypothetical protein
VNDSPTLLHGKWYVSIPATAVYYMPLFGGPFDSESDARQWLHCLPLIKGASVWKHAVEPLTPHDVVAAARACAPLRLRRVMGQRFREFLARRLDDEAPATAAKIRAATGPELAAIYDAILRVLSEEN